MTIGARLAVAGADRFTSFVAIDWSGAVGERQRGIALALCGRGDAAPALIRPAGGWSRRDVLDWLTGAAPADCLIGLDLGTALPFADAGAYFPGWEESPADARGLWALVERLSAGDPNLAASAFVDHPPVARHFRRHGGRCGEAFFGRGRLRVTEIAQRAAGLNPYSNLNLVGAAQVGKASLTGMRVLHRLSGRIAIWPFDPLPARGPVIVEIYTAIAAVAAGRAKGRSKMRTAAELDAALAELGTRPSGRTGAIDDHSADAILSAAWLRRNAALPQLWRPQGLTAAIAATEGWTFGIG